MAQWNETFENTLVYPPWLKQGTYSTFNVSPDYAIAGTKSWKSIMPAEVYSSNGNARNELTHYSGSKDGVEGAELNLTVYSKKLAVYFPSDYKFDSSYTYPSQIHWSIIWQYHGYDGGTHRTQPSIPLYEDNGQLRMYNNWSDVYLGTGQSSVVLTHPDTGLSVLGTITKGSWHYFHIEVLWDWRTLANGGTGYLKVYMSKTGWPTSADIIANYSGPTGYNDPGGPYFKLGIYKWNWVNATYVNAAIAAGCTEIVRYYDDYTNAKGQLALNEIVVQRSSTKKMLLAV